jgi:acyl-CoA thioester hydrolase
MRVRARGALFSIVVCRARSPVGRHDDARSRFRFPCRRPAIPSRARTSPTSASATTPSSFEQRRHVQAGDLDDQAHVNNVVYVQWVQDIALAHWRTVASAEAQATLGWVAMRHEIDYLAPAVLGDEIHVRTWVGPATGLSFERNTEIRRVGDDRLLARARTLWCPVDPQTGRPRRVRAEIRAQFSDEAGT